MSGIQIQLIYYFSLICKSGDVTYDWHCTVMRNVRELRSIAFWFYTSGSIDSTATYVEHDKPDRNGGWNECMRSIVREIWSVCSTFHDEYDTFGCLNMKRVLRISMPCRVNWKWSPRLSLVDVSRDASLVFVPRAIVSVFECSSVYVNDSIVIWVEWCKCLSDFFS